MLDSSLRRTRTAILDVGESTLDVDEQTVGETTRRRNDRLPRIIINFALFVNFVIFVTFDGPSLQPCE